MMLDITLFCVLRLLFASGGAGVARMQAQGSFMPLPWGIWRELAV
jgi:hypothetical protein